MLDHVFITVKDLDRSIAFYETPLKPLGIVHALDYDGKDGPEGHPNLKGFGHDGRVFFWLKQGDVDARAAHIGVVAKSEAEVDAFNEAAMAAGATDNGKPGARLYYDPRYYATNVFDPDGYSLDGDGEGEIHQHILLRRSAAPHPTVSTMTRSIFLVDVKTAQPNWVTVKKPCDASFGGRCCASCRDFGAC